MTSERLVLPALQMDLFAGVSAVYGGTDRELSNDELYARVGSAAGIDASAWDHTTSVGKTGAPHKVLRRKVRWYQQTMKGLGLLEHGSERGRWRLTPLGKKKLTSAPPRRVLLGFSTELGLALWSSCEDVFKTLGEPISLCLTSPPYPLAVPRAYGNPTAAHYVDWMCSLLEPIVRQLMPGGSIALNISNDIFEPRSPARSLYRERLAIALHDRLELHKMDELIWKNDSKAPGPLRYASLDRTQLNVNWEPVLWFTNNPALVRSNNRRVLQEHNERHLKLMAAGGEQRVAAFGDGANRIRKGSYGTVTAGKIPRNVLSYGHKCIDQRPARDFAHRQGIAEHGAAMPLSLARFLVEFLTEPGDLIVDPFAGWFTTAKAAEITGRRWLGTEQVGEYILGGAQRFLDCDGFELCGSTINTFESRP